MEATARRVSRYSPHGHRYSGGEKSYLMHISLHVFPLSLSLPFFFFLFAALSPAGRVCFPFLTHVSRISNNYPHNRHVAFFARQYVYTGGVYMKSLQHAIASQSVYTHLAVAPPRQSLYRRGEFSERRHKERVRLLRVEYYPVVLFKAKIIFCNYSSG